MEMKKSLIKLQCVAALMLTVGAPTMQSVSLVHADTTTQTQKDATSFEAKLTSKSEQPGTVLLRHTGGKELSLTKVELIDKDGKSLATIYDAAKEDASVTKKGDDIFVKFNAPKAEGMTVKVSYDKSKLGDKEAIATVAVLLKDNGGTAASKQFNAKTESKDAINKSMDDALNELKELNKDTSKKEDDSKKDDSKKDESKKEDTPKKEDDSKKDDSKKDDTSKKDDSKKEDDSKKDDSKKDDSKKDDSKKDDSKKDDTSKKEDDSKKDDSKKDETKPSTDLKKEDTNKKDDKLPETKPSTDDKKDDVKKDETKPSTDVKKDDVKKDETKPSTDVKKDDVKKDDVKKDDVKKDDVKKDETKPSTDVKKDDVKKEDGNGKNDRPSLDDLKKDETKPSTDVKKDETKPSTDVKKDETKTAPTADAKNLFAPIVKEKYDLSTHRVDRAKTISELLVSSYEKASKNSKLSDNVKAEKEAADKAVANLKAEAAKTSATPESLNKAYSPAFDAVKALSDKIDGKVSNTVKKDDVKKEETKPSTDVKKDDVKKDETKPSTDVKKDDVKSDETKKDETAPSSDVKKDEVKSDDAKKDETKPSADVKQDQTQPSSSAKIQGKAPIKGKYANTNEKTNPIAVIAGALGLALAGVAGVIGWKKHKESNENESSEN